MKSEYDRNFQWHYRDDMDIERAKNALKKTRASEPLMTHKRRVRVPEDNVMIGIPLTSQKGADSEPSEDAYFVLGNKNERFTRATVYRNSRLGDRRRVGSAESVAERDRSRRQRHQIFSGHRETRKEVAVQADVLTPREDHEKKHDPEIHWRVREKPKLQRNDQGIQQKVREKTQLQRNDPEIHWREREKTQLPSNDPGIQQKIREKTQLQRNDPEIHRRQLVKVETSRQEVKKNRQEWENDVQPSQKIKICRQERERSPHPPRNGEDKQSLQNAANKPKEPARAKLVTEYTRNYDCKSAPPRERPISDHNEQNRSSVLETKLRIYSNFESEYQRQFRPYEFVTDARYRRMRPVRESDEVSTNVATAGHGTEPGQQLQFMEPVPPRRALTPPARSWSGLAVQEMRNPQPLMPPHGPHKKKHFLTEYNANYDDKWSRIEAELALERERQERDREVQQSRWLREITELRERAREYRQRARGTHFSREHLATLWAGPSAADTVSRGLDQDDNDIGGSDSGGRRSCSSVSTIVGRRSRSGSRSPTRGGPLTRSSPGPPQQCWAAGKPSADNDLFLRPQETPRVTASHKYALQRFLRGSHDSVGDRDKEQDYSEGTASSQAGSVATSSASSVSSSDSLSLARETLDRAKRNRDEILRHKMR